MRMEAPTKRSDVVNIKLQPPEEAEVLGLTTFLMQVYDGHMEQQHGIHVGAEEEWRGYVTGLFQGGFRPDMPHPAHVAVGGGGGGGGDLIFDRVGVAPVAGVRGAGEHPREG